MAKYDMDFGERVTEEFQRNRLNDLLAQVPDSQRRIFELMYPRGVSRAGLAWALTQVNNGLTSASEKNPEV